MRRTLILLALVFAMAAPLIALGDTIKLRNGRKLYGKIIKETEDEVIIRQKDLGQITLKRNQISEIIRDEHQGPAASTKPEEKKELGQEPGEPDSEKEAGKKLQPQVASEPEKKKPEPAGEERDLLPRELDVSLKPKKAWSDKQGTYVAAELSVKDGAILAWELLRAEIPKFEDNVGTELGKKDKKEFYGSAGVRSVQTLTDGKKFEITFDAKGTPRDAATEVSLRCTLPFWYATKKESGTVEKISLAEGSTFKLGGIEMKIASLEERKNYKGNHEQQVEVHFTVEGPWVDDILAELKFTDLEGKDVEWHQSIITGAIPKSGPIECKATWHFETKVKEVGLNYTLWKDMQYRCAAINANVQLKKD